MNSKLVGYFQSANQAFNPKRLLLGLTARLQKFLESKANSEKSHSYGDAIMALTAIALNFWCLWTGVFLSMKCQNHLAPLICFAFSYAVMFAYSMGNMFYLNSLYGGVLLKYSYQESWYVTKVARVVAKGTDRPYDGGLIPARLVISAIFCSTSFAYLWTALGLSSHGVGYGWILASYIMGSAVSLALFALSFGHYAFYSRADVASRKTFRNVVSGRLMMIIMGVLANAALFVQLIQFQIEHNQAAMIVGLPCLIFNGAVCLGSYFVFDQLISRSQDCGVKESA